MLDASGLALLVTALLVIVVAVVVLALVAIVGLVVGSHLWVRRADSRAARDAGPAETWSTAAVGASPRPRAALVQVRAEDARGLRDALDRSVRIGTGTSLLVSRQDDVLPSSAQLDGAAVALEDPDTAFVTFADDDTPAARVRADRGLVVAAPGPIAVRADAVLEAGGWPADERLPETDLGARMVGLGWRGAALGVAPGAVCDARARERQVAWHLVRRHRGLLVAGRRAGNDLAPGERSALLASTVVALTSVPSGAELSRVRAWCGLPRLVVRRSGRASGRRAVLGAAGVLVAVGVSAAFVALPRWTAGAGETPVTGRATLPTADSRPGDDLQVTGATAASVSPSTSHSASPSSAGPRALERDHARPPTATITGDAAARRGAHPRDAHAERSRHRGAAAAQPRAGGKPGKPGRTGATGKARPTGHSRPSRSSKPPRSPGPNRPAPTKSAPVPSSKPAPKPAPPRQPAPAPRPPKVAPAPAQEPSTGQGADHGAGHGAAHGGGHGQGGHGHDGPRPGKGH